MSYTSRPFIPLAQTILTIVCKVHELRSSSLCKFLQSSTASVLLTDVMFVSVLTSQTYSVLVNYLDRPSFTLPWNKIYRYRFLHCKIAFKSQENWGYGAEKQTFWTGDRRHVYLLHNILRHYKTQIFVPILWNRTQWGKRNGRDELLSTLRWGSHSYVT